MKRKADNPELGEPKRPARDSSKRRLRIKVDEHPLYLLRLSANQTFAVNGQFIEVAVEDVLAQTSYWITPLVYPNCLAMGLHRLTSRTGKPYAENWDVKSVLAPVHSPWVSTVEKLAAQGAAFMQVKEDSHANGQLTTFLSVSLDKQLRVALPYDLHRLTPIKEASGLVLTTSTAVHLDGVHTSLSPEQLDNALGQSTGLSINLYTGEISPFPLPLVASVAGAILADEPGLEKKRTVACFLEKASGLSLLATSDVGQWIAALCALGRRLRIVTSKKTWASVSSYDLGARDVVLITYKFIQSDTYREYHRIVSSEHVSEGYFTKFCTLCSMFRRGASEGEHSARIMTNMFSVDLAEFLSLCEEKKLFEEKNDPNEEYRALFDNLISTRVCLTKVKWSRVLLDKPRISLYHDFLKNQATPFSAEEYGRFVFKGVVGDRQTNSRSFVHFILAACSGFKWIIETHPYLTLCETKACFDLIDFKINGLPWTIYSEFALRPVHIPHDVTKLREFLFTWTSLVALTEVCCLRRHRKDFYSEKVSVCNVQIPMTPLEVHAKEVARKHITDKILQIYQCLELKEGEADLFACMVCDARANLFVTDCNHVYCEPCFQGHVIQAEKDGKAVLDCGMCRRPVAVLRAQSRGLCGTSKERYVVSQVFKNSYALPLVLVSRTPEVLRKLLVMETSQICRVAIEPFVGSEPITLMAPAVLEQLATGSCLHVATVAFEECPQELDESLSKFTSLKRQTVLQVEILEFKRDGQYVDCSKD